MVYFASLFCVDFDLDLLPHWIKHYIRYDFDDYHIWLHSPENSIHRLRRAREDLSRAGFMVHNVNGDFLDGSLRIKTVGQFDKILDPKRDKLVTADSDEFQKMPLNYKTIAQEFDYIHGFLIDRYDDTLHSAAQGIDIDVQYLHEGQVIEEVIKDVPQGHKSGWVHVKNDKILCAPAGSGVAFGGSHCFYDGPRDLVKWPASVPVLHYTWRDSIIQRMCGKRYFTAPQIWYVANFFNALDSKPLQQKIRDFEVEQIEKGWVPA